MNLGVGRGREAAGTAHSCSEVGCVEHDATGKLLTGCATSTCMQQQQQGQGWKSSTHAAFRASGVQMPPCPRILRPTALQAWPQPFPLEPERDSTSQHGNHPTLRTSVTQGLTSPAVLLPCTLP